MLKISFKKLIKQIIYKISNQMQRNVYKKVRLNKIKIKINGLILFIMKKIKEKNLISFRNNFLSSFPFLQNQNKNKL
jgi:hypothetical protein